jgi:hypothetical protein
MQGQDITTVEIPLKLFKTYNCTMITWTWPFAKIVQVKKNFGATDENRNKSYLSGTLKQEISQFCSPTVLEEL